MENRKTLNIEVAKRKKAWPTYDKGCVCIDETDAFVATEVIRKKHLFRYDVRNYHDTEVGKLEKNLCKYFGSQYALAVSSGTAAITLALMAAGIKSGDKVACPAFAFPATPSAILLAGATPILIEVDENLHIDLNDLLLNITDSMKAIIVVHMRGYASDIEKLTSIGNKFHIPIIEDAVPAMGVKFKNKFLGTFGTAGAFSTQSDKSINTGEGGFLLTNSREIYNKAIVLSGAYENRWRDHFHESEISDSFCDLHYPLFNFRLDEIRGAIANNQLKKIEKRITVLRENFKYVLSKIDSFSEIKIRKPIVENAFLGDCLLFRLADEYVDRTDWFVSQLCELGIDARSFSDKKKPNVRCYWNWMYLFPNKDVNEIRSLLPKSTEYLSSMIDIPLSPLLTKDDIDGLVNAIEYAIALLP